MTLPLEQHEYGQHDVVLPPPDGTAFDDAAIDLDVRLVIYRMLEEMRQFEKRAPREAVRQPTWSHELMAGYWSSTAGPTG